MELTIVGVTGVYGLAYAVGRRVRELGVRIALGAVARDVVLLVLKQQMRPIAIGAAVGFAPCEPASIQTPYCVTNSPKQAVGGRWTVQHAAADALATTSSRAHDRACCAADRLGEIA